MEEQKRTVKLMKFGKKIHMEAFQGGELFMNTLKHFQGLEDSGLRGDKDEGLSAIYQANGATLSRKNEDGDFVPLGTINDQLEYREKDSVHVNVFCMYALQVEPQKLEINRRNLEFGDTFVILLDIPQFLDRIKEAAKQMEVKVFHGMVDYVDRATHKGPIGPFRKFNEYSYQSEFRIIIPRKSLDPYMLNIGDISDITELEKLS